MPDRPVKRSRWWLVVFAAWAVMTWWLVSNFVGVG